MVSKGRSDNCGINLLSFLRNKKSYFAHLTESKVQRCSLLSDSHVFGWRVMELQKVANSVQKGARAGLRGKQFCPTRGPGEGFVRPSLGFRCSTSSLHTDNLSLF